MKRNDEHKKNDTGLTESLLLHSFIESPQEIIIFTLDQNYRYTAFTKFYRATMKKIWGVDIGIGMNILDLIASPEDRQKAKNNFDRALHGEYFVLEEEYGSENRKRTSYHSHYNPIKDLNGNITGLSVFVIAFTEKYTAQKTIAESEEKYRTLAETAGDIIIVYNPKGEITYLNQAGLAFTNLTKENYFGKNLLSFIPEKYHDLLAQNYRQRREGFLGKRIYEMDLLDKNGNLFPVEIASSPIVSDGIITGFISIARDISGRKLTELELKKSEKRYRLLIEHAQDMVFTLTPEGILTYISPSSKQFSGYDDSQEIGKHFSHYLADQSQLEEVNIRFKQLIAEQVTQVMEFLFMHKDQGPFWTEVIAKPIIDDNKVVEVHCVLRNIEERKQAEDKIKSQLSELQKWHATTLRREERIIEIKKEVNTLLQQAGKPKKYSV